MTKTKTFSPHQLINQLKSGRWRKARESLGRGEVTRCCLGVACEMAGVDWQYKIEGESFTDLGMGLPQGIHDHMTFERAFPWLNYDLQEDLGGLNDSTPGWDAVIERLEEIDRALKVETKVKS